VGSFYSTEIKNSPRKDVGRIQRPKNPKIRTLTGTNVFFLKLLDVGSGQRQKLVRKRRWSRPTSGNPEKKALVAANV